ncbi:MAG: hypothetical protein JWR01_2119 [Subtercola sp.]|nr:hypothetical protein [Subtercola sp.]
MRVAAEIWRVELRRRSPEGWKRTGWGSRAVVRAFVGRASGAADLIFFSVDDTKVVHLVPAGDEEHSERLLAAARRDLLDLPSGEFARQWGFPPAT